MNKIITHMQAQMKKRFQKLGSVQIDLATGAIIHPTPNLEYGTFVLDKDGNAEIKTMSAETGLLRQIPAYAIWKDIKDIKKGDLVVLNGVTGHVLDPEVAVDGVAGTSVRVLDIQGDVKIIALTEDTMVPGKGLLTVTNVLTAGGIGGEEGVNPMMMALLMDDKGLSNSDDNGMLFALLAQGGGDAGIANMNPLVFCLLQDKDKGAGKDGSMLSMLLMQQFAGGNGSGDMSSLFGDGTNQLQTILLMDAMKNDSDGFMQNMLQMSILSGSGNDNPQMSNLMLMSMFGKDSGGGLSDVMMMNMLNGGAGSNPFGNLFGGACGCKKTETPADE